MGENIEIIIFNLMLVFYFIFLFSFKDLLVFFKMVEIVI